LVLTVGTLLVQSRRGTTPADIVVVPPFENLSGDRSVDTLASMTAAWVTQGLAATGLTDVVDLPTALRGMQDSTGLLRTHSERLMSMARRAGATMVVRGSISLRNDSLIVMSAIVRTRDAVVLVACEPVDLPLSSVARVPDEVRERVLGALAAFRSPRFTAWRGSLSTFPRYDSYQEFVEGLDLLAQRRRNPALAHFISAARLDTGFVQAKLFAFRSMGSGSFWTTAFQDSLIDVANRQRARLTPYDRAALDEVMASGPGDWEGAYLAARRMVALAPKSADAAYTLAYDAFSTNRFTEAIEALHRVGFDRGWMDAGTLWLQLETNAHHFAGDFAGELAEAQRAFGMGEHSYRTCFYAFRPLAAMGREAELNEKIQFCGAFPNAATPAKVYSDVGAELYFHGYPDPARRFLEDALARFKAGSAATPNILHVEFQLRDWNAVVALLAPMLARDSGSLNGNELMALGASAARLGDTATAFAMDRRLAALAGANDATYEMFRGMIAASLGRQIPAMVFLRSAMEHGLQSPRLHARPSLDLLRGYRPFEALLNDRN
jgi:TolB-like protein